MPKFSYSHFSGPLITPAEDDPSEELPPAAAAAQNPKQSQNSSKDNQDTKKFDRSKKSALAMTRQLTRGTTVCHDEDDHGEDLLTTGPQPGSQADNKNLQRGDSQEDSGIGCGASSEILSGFGKFTHVFFGKELPLNLLCPQ